MSGQRKLLVRGGNPLHGTVSIPGSKNVALSLLSAAILSPGPLTIRNVPKLPDVETVLSIYEALGISFERISPHELAIDPTTIRSGDIPGELSSQIRYSICIGTAVLARLGEVEVGPVGGDAFTYRPVDLHLQAYELAGAEILVRGQRIHARLLKRHALKSFRPFTGLGPSLGATLSGLILASTSRSASSIINPSIEPEVVKAGELLASMGVSISGTPRAIEVRGVPHTTPSIQTVPPDRIVAGTYICGAALTEGAIDLNGIFTDDLTPGFRSAMANVGINLTDTDSGLRTAAAGRIRPTSLATGPHPGFPTDLQPPFTALLTKADGSSRILESVYNSRWTHVKGLSRMGANVVVAHNAAAISGPTRLSGARLVASDIRQGAAYLVAALSTRDISIIKGVHHLQRGHEDFAGNLAALGADVTMVT